MSYNFGIIVLKKILFCNSFFYQSENRIPFSLELRPAWLPLGVGFGIGFLVFRFWVFGFTKWRQKIAGIHRKCLAKNGWQPRQLTATNSTFACAHLARLHTHAALCPLPVARHARNVKRRVLNCNNNNNNNTKQEREPKRVAKQTRYGIHDAFCLPSTLKRWGREGICQGIGEVFSSFFWHMYRYFHSYSVEKGIKPEKHVAHRCIPRRMARVSTWTLRYL